MYRVRNVGRRLLLGILALVLPALPTMVDLRPAQAQAPEDVAPRQNVPTDAYFLFREAFYTGDYTGSLQNFQACLRGAIKNGPNFWIDSICYHTMCGETYYQMGQYAPALEHYNSAVTLALTFNDWMIPVRFPPTLAALPPQQVRPIPWGKSERQLIIGNFPDTAVIRQGQVDQSQVVMRGGVVQQAIDFPINPQEIARCTCLAIRRRRDLLGPLAAYDELNNQLIAALSRRPVQPNHWSEAWLDIELGCAFAAAGKDVQAKPILERAVITGGQFDHPLTSIALIELGRIALNAGVYDAATKYFQEAGYSAFHFLDPMLIEDSLRYAAVTHVLANRPGPYLPITVAAEWARRQQTLRQLQCQLIALAAEGQCLIEQPKAALALLDGSRAVTNRTDIMQGRIGAQLNYQFALAQYQLGNVVGGDGALTAAMNFEKTGSLKLFHLTIAEQMLTAKTLSLRNAKEVFAGLLRDPVPSDWQYDPLETMALLVHHHPHSYERWIEASLESNELNGRRACEIADLAKRHKFLASQDLGGRLLNLRWLLEGPIDLLPEHARLQRQSLLTQFPAYAQLSQQARNLQVQIAQQPLTAADPTAAKQQSAKLVELNRICSMQEVLLRVMALRRLPAELVFPPIRTVEEIQKSLPFQRGVLSYYSGSRNAYGFLMTNDKFGYWPLPAGSEILKTLTALLQACGNYGENRPLRSADLASNAWQEPARRLYDQLLRDSKADLPTGFDELTISPDGSLWYVPFETLISTASSRTAEPLGAVLRTRYAPTLGLAVGDSRPRLEKPRSLVTLGKLYPTDADEVTDRAFSEFKRSVPQSESIRLKPGSLGGGAVFAAAADRVVVLADIPPPAGPYAWNPLAADRGVAGGALIDWLRLPWHGPEQIAIPGFHTPAEDALKTMSLNDAGNDLFFGITGLMGCGARTVLISRWRPAGRTSHDLVREFMQELPYTSAAKAWQRSVRLVQQTPIDPELEPRVTWETGTTPPRPTHPFFWAPYLVVDTGSEPPGAEDAKPSAVDAVIPK